MTAVIYVSGKQKAQPRLRPTIRGGKLNVYMPKTAQGFRDEVALAWRSYQGVVFKGPIKLLVQAYFQCPKSKAKTTLELTPYTSKPDGDNLLKSIADALTHAGAWSDDASVYDMRIVKYYTLGESYTSIRIEGEAE
jgi:Holliday junction resolvase RusA-like endonuclease